MNNRDRITTALVALRIGVFIVMLMWTLDKFVNVTHASGVFEHFYGLRGFGPGIMAAIGVAELLLILAFVLGYQKRISYAGRALPSNRRRGHQRAATETTAQVERAILPIVPRRGRNHDLYPTHPHTPMRGEFTTGKNVSSPHSCFASGASYTNGLSSLS
jgi:hypothetical protein